VTNTSARHVASQKMSLGKKRGPLGWREESSTGCVDQIELKMGFVSKESEVRFESKLN